MSVDKNRWVHSNTVVHNLGYHLIWCTKYRRKVLNDEIQGRLKVLLTTKTEELGCKLLEIETMPDHVHLFVKTKPTISPHYLVQQLKGYSSRVLRSEFSSLKSRLPTLWTRSYYVESVGHISEQTVLKYIADQKNK